MRRSFMVDSVDEDLGEGSLPGDPSMAFSDFSFRVISRENWIRKICIRIVLSP